jgi:16S rRNA (cytosine967-C5)-methyltransferase
LSASPGRRAALETLQAVRRGELADRALGRAVARLDARERAFTHELAYGTFRLRGRLDHRLAAHATRPLDRIDADVLDVLRLGAFQLTAMDGVPPYAAVSQSVELVRSIGPQGRRAAGFVNAVLHSLARAPDAAGFPAFEADPVGHLTTWGSHPAWLVERWIAVWGADAARALVEANNRRPAVFLHVLVGTASDAVERLAVAGIEAVEESVAGTVRLVAAADVATALDVVPAVVLDPAAAAVAHYALPLHGLIADLCAAPGGKALALAAAVGHGGCVLAADRSPERLARLIENAARPGRPRLHAAVADARRPPLARARAVLLDVPCTGTGTLRRHPDARWRVEPDDLKALCALQAELLTAAARIVEPGGVLVYATCSLEPEENEAQVEAFLEANPDFRLEPGMAPDGWLEDGRLVALPQRQGYDGAFAARLRRAG